MIQKILEFLLNTPKSYQLFVAGYHVHKTFWGILLIIISLSFFFGKKIHRIIPFILLIIGIILIALDVTGHMYTHHTPYFILLERVKP